MIIYIRYRLGLNYLAWTGPRFCHSDSPFVDRISAHENCVIRTATSICLDCHLIHVFWSLIVRLISISICSVINPIYCYLNKRKCQKKYMHGITKKKYTKNIIFRCFATKIVQHILKIFRPFILFNWIIILNGKFSILFGYSPILPYKRFYLKCHVQNFKLENVTKKWEK